MNRRACLTLGIGWLASSSCDRPEHRGRIKAIVGALAIDPGGETFPNSVVLVSSSHIQRVGSSMDVSIPSGAETWDVKDRFIIPAPVELGRGVIMPKMDSLAEANLVLIRTPEAVEGIVGDTDELPAALVRSLAAADTIVTPRLARLQQSPAKLERGLRHIRTLLDVRVRLASFAGPDAAAEWRLMARAGMTPKQVLESATFHAARVARQQDDAGSLRVGSRANLWVLRRNPLTSADNLTGVDSIMLEGVWQRNPGVPN